jgi:hypothetical protein
MILAMTRIAAVLVATLLALSLSACGGPDAREIACLEGGGKPNYDFRGDYSNCGRHLDSSILFD